MNEETYKDAKLLAMGILNYINAVDKQGGDKQAMSRCLWEAWKRCGELQRKIDILRNKLNK